MTAPADQFIFSEKRTLCSNFSPNEMQRIAQSQSKAEARKYFITTFVVPLAITSWYQGEDSKICCVRIIPVDNKLSVHLAFEPVANSHNRSITDVKHEIESLLQTTEVFHTNPPELWHSSVSLGDALMSAFDECLPDDWLQGYENKLSSCPLIASIKRSPVSTGETVALTVLIKTKQNVRKPEYLLNQADYKGSPLCIKSSVKYNKMYNILTGAWVGVCSKAEPAEICPACQLIYAGPAADNAYHDPDFN